MPRRRCRGDQEAEVGDVRARRVRVARDREAADEPPVGGLGDEDRGVVEPPERLQVAPLLARAAPRAAREEPALGLARRPPRERDERLRVGRLGPADVSAAHSTTMPAPPRRGSPAAASVPSARTSTAAAPPKKRLRFRQRTTS